MRYISKAIYLSLTLSMICSMTAFARRYDPDAQIGPITAEDAWNLDLDRTEEDIINRITSAIEYDENTDTYYEDTYTKAAPGNWRQDDKGWQYHLDDGTHYVNGWVRIDGTRYYFDENGYMKTGWIQKNDHWYYTDETGALVTGSRQIDGITYSFNAYGQMAE